MVKKLNLFFALAVFCGSVRAQTFAFDAKDLKVGQTHVCWQIGFVLGESEVMLDQSKQSMDSIVKFLNDHPSVKIEIGQHSQKRGDPKYNLSQSQKRAESVRNYLLQQGIDSLRVTAKGYGQTRPYFSKEQEIQRAGRTDHARYPSNFRTEVRITGI